MVHDTRAPARRDSGPSDACQAAERALLLELERSSRGMSAATRDAVTRYAESLASEGLTPEATVIAFKQTLAMSASLGRLGTAAREEFRASLVSLCIDTYFARRDLADAPSRRPDWLLRKGRQEPPPDARV